MNERRRPRARARTRGFTLVELLVVLTIILLVSAATLPTIIPALSHREVSEAARILQAALVGAHDAAIRANEPRGIRLLPDPALTQPPFSTVAGAGVPGTLALTYNRFVPIQPAPQYNDGLVAVRAYNDLNHPIVANGGFPPLYPRGGGVYPYPFLQNPNNALTCASVLMLEESPYFNDADPTQGINSPTSWYWNIRVGDQVRLQDSGRYYTVVGPMTLGPASTPANPEMFVNVGPPGTLSPLSRSYSTGAGQPIEFLFLVNGQDDNNNGLVDEGWNNLDDWSNGYNPSFPIGPLINGVTDELSEWEVETWLGPQSKVGFVNQTYTITRRPVPMQGAREVNLPPKVVIDATSWLTAGVFPATQERSRLPVDQNTLYVDVMISPSGQVLPTSAFSNSFNFNSGIPFYHFWLTEREGVHTVTDLNGGQISATAPSLLPLPVETYANMGLSPAPALALTGERRLLTLFMRSGLITNNAIESSTNPAADAFMFPVPNTTNYIYSANAPFVFAESGGRGEVE